MVDAMSKRPYIFFGEFLGVVPTIEWQKSADYPKDEQNTPYHRP
jgi:hypothetical protein